MGNEKKKEISRFPKDKCNAICSAYTRSLKQFNSQKQKVKWWLSGSGNIREWELGIEVQFCKMEKFQSTVNVPKTTELYL